MFYIQNNFSNFRSKNFKFRILWVLAIQKGIPLPSLNSFQATMTIGILQHWKLVFECFIGSLLENYKLQFNHCYSLVYRKQKKLNIIWNKILQHFQKSQKLNPVLHHLFRGPIWIQSENTVICKSCTNTST